ncbi:MAG: DinB family protein [Armatimonadetes bacterium]|nr:DinB family protein [Armatimonadota bacterium]MBS1727206.1 DinB family protein [Armatimonadota bacterium]
MSTPIKDATVGQLSTLKSFFLKDLSSLSDEQLNSKPNGCARKPIDFCYEVVSVNQEICRMLQQLPADESRGEGEKDGQWTAAPKGYTREQLEADFAASMDAIVEVVSGASEEKLLANIPTWFGEQPMYSFAMFAGIHANYHNAQISYVAQMGGDLKNYWF